MNQWLLIIGMMVIWVGYFIIWTALASGDNNLFDLFFKKVTNNITDIHDPNYTGGVEYKFLGLF